MLVLILEKKSLTLLRLDVDVWTGTRSYGHVGQYFLRDLALFIFLVAKKLPQHHVAGCVQGSVMELTL